MRRSLRTTAVALLAASFLALLDLFRTTMVRVLEGRSLTHEELVLRVLPMWITVVIASPWCALMARWFPFRGGRVLRTLAAHAGGAAVFVALQMSLLIGFHLLRGGARVSPFWPGLLHSFAFYIAMEASVYAAIVIVVLLLDTRREARERALVSARLESSLAAARLDSLRSQLRPHFLFNTLNALAILARKGDGAAVDRAIADLGELLRASFESSDRQEIPLRDELSFLERYLHLMGIRFPDRLVVEWQIEEEALRARVPVLLVQPVVENALEHGLKTARGGSVRVIARRDGDALEVEVQDDGPGFGATSSEASRGEPAADGVGLANTRERLALLYGERATLACGNRPGGGGSVRIRIPWRAGEGAGVA